MDPFGPEENEIHPKPPNTEKRDRKTTETRSRAVTGRPGRQHALLHMLPPASLPATTRLPRGIGKGRIRDEPGFFDAAYMSPGTRETTRSLSEKNIIQNVHEYSKQSGRRFEKRTHDKSVRMPIELTRPLKIFKRKCGSATGGRTEQQGRRLRALYPLRAHHALYTVR